MKPRKRVGGEKKSERKHQNPPGHQKTNCARRFIRCEYKYIRKAEVTLKYARSLSSPTRFPGKVFLYLLFFCSFPRSSSYAVGECESPSENAMYPAVKLMPEHGSKALTLFRESELRKIVECTIWQWVIFLLKITN